MNRSKDIDLRFFQYVRLLRFKLSFRQHQKAIVFGERPQPAAEASSPLMIFTAADSGYLQRFLQPFCRSAAAHMHAPRIHIHLYNPGPEDFGLLEGMRKELPLVALSWSHETFSPEERERRSPSSSQQSWKSLYICCSRFIAAAAAQEAFRLPVLITDIDVLFNGDVTKRFGKDTDVALFLRPEARNLCKRALGGMVYASCSPAGKQFLAHVAKDVSRFLAAGFYWFAFDQFALYRAVLALPAGMKYPQLSLLTSKDMSLDLDPDGLILVPKGKAKDQGAFAALSARYGAGGQDGSHATQNGA